MSFRLDGYYREQHVRQCYPGRTGVSESSCVIFFQEQRESPTMFRIRKKKFERPEFTVIA